MTTAFMPLYIGDIKRKTDDLGPTEYGILMRLIGWAWDHEGTIPRDQRKLCNITRCEPRLWAKLGQPVVNAFFDMVDASTMQQKRVVEELRKYQEKSNKNREAALRMHSKRRANAVQTHMQSESESKEEGPSVPPPAAAGPSPAAERSEALPVNDSQINGKAHSPRRAEAGGTRLPDDWTPPIEVLNRLRAKGYRSDVIAEQLQRFGNYFRSQPGQKGRKLRWDLTFENWVTGEKNPKFQPGHNVVRLNSSII